MSSYFSNIHISDTQISHIIHSSSHIYILYIYIYINAAVSCKRCPPSLPYIIIVQTCGKRWDLPKFVDVLSVNLGFSQSLIYTRIILVSSFSFSVSLLFPPAFAEDRFLSSWCHSHKWFQMCSYPFASKQISLVLELIEELLLCHKGAHMLLLSTFLVRPGSAQLRSIRPSIHQTRSQKESWQTLWKRSKNKTHFRCTQSQATFLSFSLFGTIWDD